MKKTQQLSLHSPDVSGGFFLCLSDICVSSFEDCVFVLFAHLLIEAFDSSSLCSLDTPYQLCTSAKISPFYRLSSLDCFFCSSKDFKSIKISSISCWLYFLSNWSWFFFFFFKKALASVCVFCICFPPAV